MNNSTIPLTTQQHHFLSSRTPFYYTPRADIFPSFPDYYLSLAAPIITYWVTSCFFHILDISDWRALDQYRIHESSEVKSRNLVSKWEVVKAVILQQIPQTLLGLWWMDGAVSGGAVDHVGHMLHMLPRMTSVMTGVFGGNLGKLLLESYKAEVLYVTYWWLMPIARIFIGMYVPPSPRCLLEDLSEPHGRFVIDTWQYFLHRAMHMNKFLYKRIHSVHHRLYVPYAFGALYNHPIEGFILDTVGAGLAVTIARLSIRESTFLFVIASIKSIDDHCGYRFPWDPLQMFSENSADYHDIHHQVSPQPQTQRIDTYNCDRQLASRATSPSRSSSTGTPSSVRA